MAALAQFYMRDREAAQSLQLHIAKRLALGLLIMPNISDLTFGIEHIARLPRSQKPETSFRQARL